jgi:hypothetical protein
MDVNNFDSSPKTYVSECFNEQIDIIKEGTKRSTLKCECKM